MLLIDAMIKINACQIHKQFMKDLEHNDFRVRKQKKKKRFKPQSKRIGQSFKKKIRKLPEDFCMNLGWKIIKEREHLHYANVSIFIKFAKYRI